MVIGLAVATGPDHGRMGQRTVPVPYATKGLLASEIGVGAVVWWADGLGFEAGRRVAEQRSTRGR